MPSIDLSLHRCVFSSIGWSCFAQAAAGREDCAGDPGGANAEDLEEGQLFRKPNRRWDESDSVAGIRRAPFLEGFQWQVAAYGRGTDTEWSPQHIEAEVKTTKTYVLFDLSLKSLSVVFIGARLHTSLDSWC